MKIYQVNTECPRYDASAWASYRVAARTCEEAIRKAKREFTNGERLESVVMLARADY